MTRPQHTDKTKARAITLAVEHGPAEAQRILAAEGITINPATIRSWCSRAGTATVARERTAEATEANVARWEERRSVMVHEMGDAAQKALECAARALDAAEGQRAKEFALTMAILIDKAQLLSGGSTARFGTDADRSAVVAEARERALRLVRSA